MDKFDLSNDPLRPTERFRYMTARTNLKPGAPPKVVPPVTRGDGLTERLADDITAGVLPPGFRLDEESLAARYGTSRTPVREALRNLETTGLIERRPYRGAVVSSPTEMQLAEMFAAMGEIEACCARLAAISMNAAERNALRRAHEKMSPTVRNADAEAYSASNSAWHERLYAGAHNSILEGVAKDLRRRLMPYRRAQFRAPNRLAQSFAEHEHIIQAIERGQGDDAAAQMRHHMRIVEAAFEAIPERS